MIILGRDYRVFGQIYRRGREILEDAAAQMLSSYYLPDYTLLGNFLNSNLGINLRKNRRYSRF